MAYAIQERAYSLYYSFAEMVLFMGMIASLKEAMRVNLPNVRALSALVE